MVSSNYHKCWLIRAESSSDEVQVQSVVMRLEAEHDGSCDYDSLTVYKQKWGAYCCVLHVIRHYVAL